LRKNIYLFIFFLAFAFRFFYLNQLTQSPFFNFPLVDEFEYHRWALNILSGNLLWNVIPYHGPVYPYILAGLYKIFGPYLYAARFFGAIVSSLTCVLLGHICWETMGRKAGIIAGIAAGLYWPFIYWSGEVVVETLVILLNLVVFLLLWKAKAGRRPVTIFLAGLFIGLSAATRPNILFLVPFFIIWIFIAMPRASFLKNIFFMALGMIIVIAPITLRNYCAGHEFVLIQGQSGINLYLGLNPHIDTIYDKRAGLVWDKWMLEPIRLNILGVNEQSRYWIGKAMAIVSNEPVLFLKHIFRNILLIFSRFEMSVDKDILYNRNFAPFIFSLPGFWLIGPLGICGAILGLKNRRDLGLHYAFLIGIFLSLVPFQTSSRYRLLFAAFLLMFAAFAIVEFGKMAAGRNRKGIFSFIVILLLAIGIVDLDIPGVKSKEYSRTHLNLAEVYLREAETLKALDETRQYLRLYPDDPEAYKMLGDIYMNTKDLSRAERAYQKALDLEPDYFCAANNIGVIKAMRNDTAGACRYFKRAVAIYPFYDEALRNLKRCEGY
jgi:4-amino-4-deoxy-L-arabinose transferase-like glycosyltransferase